MSSRSRNRILIVVFTILALLGLMLWLWPQIKNWVNPLGEAASTLEEGLDARLNATPTIRPSPSTIIRQVQSLSRLETISYTVEKVIAAETGQDTFAFLFGDRLLFVAHGQVVAGVDLAQVQEGDVTITENDGLVMVLPPAEVFVVTLDNDQSYVYERDTGLLGLNEQLETEARRAAEQEILNAALVDGILEMADANARLYLERLIRAFGFQEVTFVYATSTPPPPTLPITVVPATPGP